MYNLSEAEKNFMEIYRHFRCVKGHQIRMQNILSVKDKYLSPTEAKNLEKIIDNLIKKGYINENLKLTKLGQKYLYGEFKIEDGIFEFMKIIKHFKIISGEYIPDQSIIAKKNEFMSPLNEEYLDRIIEAAIKKGYIEERNGTLFLTDKGEKYLY